MSINFKTSILCLFVLLVSCNPLRLPSPNALSSPQATAIPTRSPTSAVKASTPTPSGMMPVDPPHGVAGSDSIGDPYIPELGNTGYDVQAYNLILDLDPEKTTYNGSIAITSTVSTENLGRISLDSIGLDISSVTVDDQPVISYPIRNKLYIDLPRPYRMGETLAIRIDYTGTTQPYYSPYAPGIGLGISKPAPGQLLALSEPDGARAWFPSNDHPLDKASFRLQASVPEGLTVVSNGALLETRTSGSKTTYTWYEDDPIATYLVALAVGDYQRVDAEPVGDIQVRHYVFKDDEKIAAHLLRTPEILQFLTDLLGPYPYDEFGFVEVDTTDLAMETQSMILVARNFWQKKDPSEILAHEAAHQWFGDRVSLQSWGESWLNEGFATYIQYLWLIEQGEPVEKLMGYAESDLLVFESIENSALVQPDPDYLFGVNPYLKGAWVLHMLRLELGDEAFFSFLKEYYRRFADGYVTTAGLQALAEEYSQRSLETFFDQWTESPALPHLQVSWSSQPGMSDVTIQVCQLQGGNPFVIPLEIRFDPESGQSQSDIVQIDEGQEQFTFSLPFTPTVLVADPDQELLANIQVEQVNQFSPCP